MILARQVPPPDERPGMNVFVLWHQYRHALEVANKRLKATQECIAELSASYAEGLLVNSQRKNNDSPG